MKKPKKRSGPKERKEEYVRTSEESDEKSSMKKPKKRSGPKERKEGDVCTSDESEPDEKKSSKKKIKKPKQRSGSKEGDEAQVGKFKGKMFRCTPDNRVSNYLRVPMRTRYLLSP